MGCICISTRKALSPSESPREVKIGRIFSSGYLLVVSAGKSLLSATEDKRLLFLTLYPAGFGCSPIQVVRGSGSSDVFQTFESACSSLYFDVAICCPHPGLIIYQIPEVSLTYCGGRGFFPEQGLVDATAPLERV